MSGGGQGRYLGLDIGSTTTKAVALDEAGALVLARVVPTGASIQRVVDQVTEGVDRAALVRTVATGYGRKRVPFATRETTEISCHAQGVAHLLPGAATVIDVGGQDSKIIRLGPGGKVLDFVMNDRCAAGTGSFLELIARALGTDLEDLSDAALRGRETVEVSSICTVFAQTEVVHLVSEGIDEARIASGVFASVVERLLPLIRRVGGTPPYALSGGVARLPAFRVLVEQVVGGPVWVPDEPQIAGALGAALFARDS